MQISIIIPVYNVEKYIEKCLKSIINQTFRNFEIIIVDDGSTDKTINICNEISKDKSNIHIFKQSNQGVSAARNFGVSKAQGEWIVFVDGDDWIGQDMLLNMYQTIENNEYDIGIVNFAYEYMDKSEDNKVICGSNVYDDVIEKTKLMKDYILYKGLGTPWAKIYRRSLLENNDIEFPKSLKRMEDVIFNLYAFQYARKIYYDDKVLYHYRLLNNSSCNIENDQFDLESLKILIEIKKFIEKFSLVREFDSVYYETALYLLVETIRLKFFLATRLSYKKKIAGIKKILSDEPYCFIYKKVNYKNLSNKWRVIYLLVKYRAIRLLYLSLLIYYSLKSKSKFSS